MSRYNVTQITNNQKGFSLVELMIVVAIVGTLAIAANFSYSPANARLKQASRDLYSNMQHARIEAVKRNENWGIICDSANNSYAVCAYEATPSPVHCVGDNTTIELSNYDSGTQFGYGNANKNVSLANIPAGISASALDGISYSSDSVYFDSKGMSPKMGYIYLENNKDTTFAVGTTSFAGVVKIYKWIGTAWK